MKIKNGVLLSVAIVLASCSNTSENEGGSGRDPDLQTVAAKAMVAANNEFALKLFNEVASTEAAENYMVSPLSVSLALGMTYNGADGTTATEFGNVLGYTDVAAANSFNQKLITSLTASDSGAKLDLAQAIWIQDDFPVEQDFVEANQTHYDAEVANLDFLSSNAVNIVNNWAYDHTNGKIEDFVERFDARTVLFLANALYFKGTWKYEFDPNDTNDAPFYAVNATEQTPMMYLNATVPYLANNRFSSILLPYKNDRYQMMVFLPNEDLTTKEIVSEFSVANLNAWLDTYSESELDINVPKFKMEYENELTDELVNLGLETAFSESADFSKINKDGALQISKVIHKTFIEVNEEGTEAAAVTGVQIVQTSARPSFVANRPFLYMIRDGFTGSICFMGQVGKP